MISLDGRGPHDPIHMHNLSSTVSL